MAESASLRHNWLASSDRPGVDVVRRTMKIPIFSWVLFFGSLVVSGAVPASDRTVAAQQSADGRAQLEEVARDCVQAFVAPIFDPLRGKLAPAVQGTSDAMRSDGAIPGPAEREALLLWVQVVMNCRDNLLSVAKQYEPPEVVAVIGAAEERNIGMLLELYAGMVSYGEYNRWHEQAAAQAVRTERRVKLELRQGTIASYHEVATIVRHARKVARAQQRKYAAGVQRQRQALKRRGMAVSCSRLGAFKVCSH